MRSHLTDYALEHADDCCLVFDRTTRVSTHYDDSFLPYLLPCRMQIQRVSLRPSLIKTKQNEDVLKRSWNGDHCRRSKAASDILEVLSSSVALWHWWALNTKMKDEERPHQLTNDQDYRNRKDKPTLQSVLLFIGLICIRLAYDLLLKPI